jgi:hypothetical protein
MEKILLSLHVLAAIVTVGPATAAAWGFVIIDRTSRRPPAPGSLAVLPATTVSLTVLHRISLAGGVAAVSVPVLGVGTAVQMDVLTDAWLLTAMALTVVAAGAYVLGVHAAQRRRLDAGPPDGNPAGRGLATFTAVFSVLWVVVVTLMVFRPGSTTGTA